MNRVYLLLGGNDVNTADLFSQSQALIEREIGFIFQKSSVYETQPWGFESENNFLNQVLLIETEYRPEIILKKVLEIEESLGRIRSRNQQYNDRAIDIDILFFNSEIIETENLIIPHPQVQNRRFALIPLAEIDAGFIHPVLNCSIEILLSKCKDSLIVKKTGGIQ